MRHSWILHWATCAMLGLSSTAFAQTYEHQHGYIFDQPYVQRISVSKAEQVSASPGAIEPLLDFEWLEALESREVIQQSGVQRQGSRLVIQFPDKKQLSLKDYVTKQLEGDYQRFRYLKRMGSFHLIAVIYAHDQPQFLLVPQAGGQIYFVDTHNTE